jgi:farnesyl diphosphate synthase
MSTNERTQPDFAPGCRTCRRRPRKRSAASCRRRTVPAKLHEAMRYTTLGGGKRVRPLLVYAAGELFGADADAVARAACAVEMIHAYSLVHDDMPCMDDDALRRGKPTVHVAYDEATALLVGDALQAQAFEVLAGARHVPPARLVAMLRLLAEAAGSAGMCGGQAIDLDSVGLSLTLDSWSACTSSRPAPAARLGAAGRLCGKDLGAARAGSAESLFARDRPGLPGGGRRAGRDRRFGDPRQDRRQGRGGNKPTYVSILGLEPSQALAEQLRRRRMRRWRRSENKHCGCANWRT